MERARTRERSPPGRKGRDVELRIETRTEGDLTVLDVSGEMDLSTANVLRDRIAELVEEGVRRLSVNLEEVGFLDSSGLSALVSGLKRMQEAGGRLSLVCSNEQILKVFTVTGLDRVFTIHGSIAEASGS
jgi:anti-sigma B factor antagonist